MNDIYIYKQKAEKYKYKYLKLKQELEGGNKSCTYDLPITFDKTKLNVDNGQIKNRLNIQTDFYTNDKNFYSFNKIGYIGRIYEYNEYSDNILPKLKLLENIPNINKDYIDTLYASTIYKEKRFFIKFGTNYIKQLFENCPIIDKTDKTDEIKRYGYIIRNNSTSLNNFSIYLKKYLKFIENFKIAIEQFIIPLHKAGYVLNNINLDNIYWDEDEGKVYFNIFQMTEITKDTDKNIDINGLSCSILNLFNKNKLFEYRDIQIVQNYYYNTKQLLETFCNNELMEIDYLLLKLDYIKELINLDTDINFYKQKEEKIIYELQNKYENILDKDGFRKNSLNEIIEQYGANSKEYKKYNQEFDNYCNSDLRIIELRNNIKLLDNRINIILQ